MNRPDRIPLLRLYEFMRVMSQKERLEFARWIQDKPLLFNNWSRRSLSFFSRLPQTEDAFHPPRAALPQPNGCRIRRGYDVAVLLANQSDDTWWEVEGEVDLSFRFVDYEVAPLRKTEAAGRSNQLPRRPGMRADLLLVGKDGTPVIGEVKAATHRGQDTDPVLALVQGLTVCAQLRSPQQAERLRNAYPSAAFGASNELDLYVIVVKPAQAPSARYQEDLYTEAKRLAPILAAQESCPTRRIAFIEARCNGNLELRLAALGSH